MAFSDILYILVVCVVLYMIYNIMDQVIVGILTGLQPSIPTAQYNMANNAWTKNRDALNNTFAALVTILFIMSILLTIYLNSHPAFIVVWFIFNIVLLYVYDGLVNIVIDFNTGGGASGGYLLASDFLVNIIGKIIVVVNIVLAIGLFAKRGSQ